MRYIILDMEWDSAYNKRLSGFINQILQIGAVRLDDDFNITDTFERTIHSSFSKKVSKRFATLTGITTEKMLSGVSFEDAVNDYNDWVGDNTVTMTWSNSDLFSILENEKNLLSGIKFHIEKYLDLQKFIQNEMNLLGHECKSQISLANAAEILGVSTDSFELHTAKDDSLICAGLLKKYYNKERFDALIRDTANPEFYKKLCFKPYYINDIKSARIDRNQLKFDCDICGKNAERTTKWHYGNRWFYANFTCNKCGRQFCGRVSFRKNYDSVAVKKKITEIKKTKEESPNDMPAMSQTL